MGFCTEPEHERFLRVCPQFEREIVEAGVILVKYFFDVSQTEQERRFLARASDPMRHWKLSPMDVESWRRWWDYTAAYQQMLEVTDTEWAPWYRIQADDKRCARLNCIAHLLSVIPYETLPFEPPKPGTSITYPPWVSKHPDGPMFHAMTSMSPRCGISRVHIID